MSKQTAVQWLLEQWPILQSQLPKAIINQALEMETEQLIEAHNYGYFDAINGEVSTNGGQDESNN